MKERYSVCLSILAFLVGNMMSLCYSLLHLERGEEKRDIVQGGRSVVQRIVHVSQNDLFTHTHFFLLTLGSTKRYKIIIWYLCKSCPS